MSFKLSTIHNQEGKSSHEFYCTVLGIVANVVSLIDSLGGGVRTLSNKKKQYPITKKLWHHCFIQQRKWYESGKTGKRFRYPENDVDYNFQNKEKTIFQFFLSGYTRKHDTVSGNPKEKNTFNPCLTTIFLRSHEVTL